MDEKRKLPKVKKTISSFLSNEEGRILKKSMIVIGSVVGGVAISRLFSDIIPAVEGDSHADYYTHNFVNSMDSYYSPDDCSIIAHHRLHAVVSHTSGK